MWRLWPRESTRGLRRPSAGMPILLFPRYLLFPLGVIVLLLGSCRCRVTITAIQSFCPMSATLTAIHCYSFVQSLAKPALPWRLPEALHLCSDATKEWWVHRMMRCQGCPQLFQSQKWQWPQPLAMPIPARSCQSSLPPEPSSQWGKNCDQPSRKQRNGCKWIGAGWNWVYHGIPWYTSMELRSRCYDSFWTVTVHSSSKKPRGCADALNLLGDMYIWYHMIIYDMYVLYIYIIIYTYINGFSVRLIRRHFEFWCKNGIPDKNPEKKAEHIWIIVDIQIRKDHPERAFRYIMIYPSLRKSWQNNQAAKEKGKLRIEGKDYVAGVLNIVEHRTMGWIMMDQKISKSQSYGNISRSSGLNLMIPSCLCGRGRVWAKHNGALQCYPRPSTYTLIYAKKSIYRSEFRII